MKYLFYYLLAINVVSFITYGIDKSKAVKQKWRIKETTLLGLAFIGGSIGALLGMSMFRHKTKKWYFVLLVPVMLILHIVGIIYLMNI